MADEPEIVEEDAEVEAPPPPPLDPAARARRDAAMRLIRRYGDPVLRAKAVPVSRFDARLEEEVQRMGVLMGDAVGVGLAAPQVGVTHRLLVYRIEPDSPVQALVNPTVEWTSKDEEWMEEGCLSLPGIHVEVERPVHVRVRAQDVRGELMLVEASGFEARFFQHEVDHLDGVLILDRATRADRKEAIKAWRELERAAAERSAA